MRTPEINDLVQLDHSVPERFLERGSCGVVKSVWCAPDEQFEVEFRQDEETPVRIVLAEQMIHVVERKFEQ